MAAPQENTAPPASRRGVVVAGARDDGAKDNSAILKGKTYALLIGVSTYKNDPPIQSLEFADKDAEAFADLLKSPLGGGLHDGDEIRLLTNQKATRAAVDDAVKEFAAKPGGLDNTLIVFVGAHGVYLTEEEDPVTHKKIEKDPYILLSDTNIQDPKTTGYAMEDFRRMVAEQTQHFGRVLVFLDICHAANVAGIAGGSELQDAVKKAWQGQSGQLGLMMASHAGESAIESASFGGGHGAFSYFILVGLNGPAAFPGDTEITFGDLAQYVRNNVRRFTKKAQDPFDEARDTSMIIVPDTRKPGLTLPPAEPLSDQEVREIRRRRGRLASPAAAPVPPSISLDDFEKAIARGILLPEESNSAFQLLEKVRADPATPPAALQELERKLRVALEDRGQEVMSRYLEGEEIPQTKADFDNCARWFEEAARLRPDPEFDRSRNQFCLGRALIFTKDYPRAEAFLTQSIAGDPRRAYSYNALGLAYLEQVITRGTGFDAAADAFRTAMRYAPYWAYPVHNLALTLAERGDYDGAIRAYEYGMSIAPRYSYLPYNLGLLYLRMGDLDNARLYFQRARETLERSSQAHTGKWPERARIWNALGTIARSESHDKKAEELFGSALSDDPTDRNARHNLALLLAGRNQLTQARQFWQSNIQDYPDFLPSRIALADSLAQSGQTADALSAYEQVVAARPDYLAAREALAKLYLQQNQPRAAIAQLEVALSQTGPSATLLELRGDGLAALGDREGARTMWSQALQRSSDRARRRG